MSESKFYFKDSFMTAMKKVIEGKPVCTGCSTRFFSRDDLEKHLKYCDAQKNSGSESEFYLFVNESAHCVGSVS